MRYSALLPTLLGLFASCFGTAAFAATEPYWNWRNPLPQGNDYYAAAYGNGRFVAVGPAGTITTSTNGTAWSAANSGVNHYLSSVAYGNGRFVVVGFNNGTEGIRISDDGLSWRSPGSSLPAGWDKVSRVTYAGDRFFAMSNGLHYVATSTDGINWTQAAGASAANVGRIGFNGGTYVGQDTATGFLSSSSGTTWLINEAKMLRSADGATWAAGGGTGLAAISAGPIYFNGRWVVGGTLVTETNGTQQFYRALSTSVDGGSTWTVEWHDPVSRSTGNATLDDIAVFSGRIYVLGDPNVPVVSTSDFVAFRVDVPAQAIQPTALATSSDHIVAVGRYGHLVSSGDGASWTVFGTSTVNGNLRGAAFGDGQWIAAGDSGLAASPDGVTWHMLPSGAGYTEGSIAYGNGRFVAGTITGYVGVSTDQGATWTNSPTHTVRGPLAFAQGRFVGSSGLVSSTDGMTWTAAVPVPGGTPGTWTNVYEVEGIFYAIGTRDADQSKDGVIARSVDGLAWTVVATMSERLASLGGKEGLLVACGFFGEVWTSTDGLTWTQVAGKPLQPFGPASSVLWVGDSLVAVTFFGQVATSVDGVTWTKDEFASSGTMFALAAGNGQVLAVGGGGTIWEVGAARFTREPESHTIAPGNPVTFSVGVTGKEPLSYQWLKDGAPLADRGTQGHFNPALKRVKSEMLLSVSASASSISGATSRTLTISAVTPGDAGRYSVVVTNALGSSESGGASLVVNQVAPPAPTLPSITSQPISKTVNAGGAVTFSVAASGDSPLSYQWRKGNAAIAGATGPTYSISAAAAADGGTYSVVVSNGAGSVTSTGVTLTVAAARLVNIATRAYASTGNDVTIGGFVIAGSEPKQVLIRAVGPTLATYGIGASEVLMDPVVELHRGADTLANNDNWSDNTNATAITAAAVRVGAAAFDAGDTKSAAMLMTLDPGVYSFIAKSKNNASGIVLLEIYDADSGGSSFANIATRARCTTNNGVTIGGFVISGSAAKQVLLRAVGPTLTTYGLSPSEVLTDPTMELHQGTTTLATNDNWGEEANATMITSAGARIGATSFSSTDTKSSALLMTLQPGVYSVIVKGKNDTSGVVLVEVYDAD